MTLTLDIVIPTAFGLEAVTAQEVRDLGISAIQTSNGAVNFRGSPDQLIDCNIRLRTANRVGIRLVNSTIVDFGTLFDRVRNIPWPDLLPKDAKINVTGRSVNSKLRSVPTCQSIVKKAIVERMKAGYHLHRLPENGDEYNLDIAFKKDLASLILDSSGFGLHRRGYRLRAGIAPLRETLAAAIVLLSKWSPDRPLADVCCGSGTICIEAAMIGQQIAPGLNRQFSAEYWPWIDARKWKAARSRARDTRTHAAMEIYGSDIDTNILTTARANARRADVVKWIHFSRHDVSEFALSTPYGCLISNPPFGERLEAGETVTDVIEKMGRIYSKLPQWSAFILNSNREFHRHFGSAPTRQRKLYNGRIQCYLYQYFGPFPPR